MWLDRLFPFKPFTFGHLARSKEVTAELLKIRSGAKWREALAQRPTCDLEHVRSNRRSQKAPVTSLHDATFAALSGHPDPSVDYEPLVRAWRAPAKKKSRKATRKPQRVQNV